MSTNVYKKGQIVWAKVRGFPWWPAVVNESNKKKNVVDKNVSLFFLAENTRGTVPVHKLEDYETNFEQFSATKNKKLQEAVKIACERYGDPRKSKKNVSNEAGNKLESDMGKEEGAQYGKDIESQDKIQSKMVEEDGNVEDEEEIVKQRRIETKGKKEEGSKFEKKQKMKRDAKNFKFTGSLDMLQRRSTRSQARNDNLEIFTEPLIYFSRNSKRNDKDSEGYSDEGSNGEDEETGEGKRRGKSSLDDEDDNSFYQANLSEQEETEKKKSKRGRKKVKVQDTKTEKKNQKNKENYNREQDISINELLANVSNLRGLNPSQGYKKQSTKYSGSARASGSYQSCSLLTHKSFNSIKTLLNSSNQSSNKHLRNLDLGKIEVVIPLQTNDVDNLRKSICQKLAGLLEESCSLDKDSAQELTLFVEGRINSYFKNDMDYYKKIMKILYKLIKIKAITIEDLKDIILISYDEFRTLLQNKIRNAISLKEEKPIAESELTQHSVNNSTESPNTANNTPQEDIILENIEIPVVVETVMKEHKLLDPISESIEEEGPQVDLQYQEDTLRNENKLQEEDHKEIQEQENITKGEENFDQDELQEDIQEQILENENRLQEEDRKEILDQENTLKSEENFDQEELQENVEEQILENENKLQEEDCKEESQDQKSILQIEENFDQDDISEQVLKNEENLEEESPKEDIQYQESILKLDEKIEQEISKESIENEQSILKVDENIEATDLNENIQSTEHILEREDKFEEEESFKDNIPEDPLLKSPENMEEEQEEDPEDPKECIVAHEDTLTSDDDIEVYSREDLQKLRKPETVKEENSGEEIQKIDFNGEENIKEIKL